MLRIGSLNFLDEIRGSSGNITRVRHFKHIHGLVSAGAHRPPDDSALHLEGCDCGQPQKYMTAKEYFDECYTERWDSSKQKLREISQDVKNSLIGKAVKWPNVAYHPLVCPYASAIFDPNSVLEVGEEKCACWRYNDKVNTNDLVSSSGIFVSRPID